MKITTKEYSVKLDVFEGPLDLLLYLVTKSEVPITEISVAAVAKQYLEYIDIIQELNLVVASEYLYIASTLIRLKAQEILPDSPLDEPEVQDNDIISKDQLIQKLIEYKKYKEAAATLKQCEADQSAKFRRGRYELFDTDEFATVEYIGQVSIYDLVAAFQHILKRLKDLPEPTAGHVLNKEDVRIDDRIEYVLSSLEDVFEVPFENLFKDDCRRIVLVVTFMALLELVKMKKILFRQESNFGTLYVKKTDQTTTCLLG